MHKAKIVVGLILITLGVVILIYGGFNYTKETHAGKLSPLKFELHEKDRVEIAVRVGVVVAASGATVLLLGKRRA